jgi:predicted component of type VI protein secretion system
LKTPLPLHSINDVEYDYYCISSIACTPRSTKLALSLWDILGKVKWEAFFWGLGTALGELPPYFVAKAAAEAGTKSNELSDYDDILSKPSHEHTWSEWIKLHLMKSMKKFGFWAILACASVRLTSLPL